MIVALFVSITMLAAPTVPDATLVEELAAAARLMTGQLPMREDTENGVVIFEKMEARGAELITTMALPVDLDEAQFGAQFELALPAQACANPQMRALIGRGATFTYIVRDRDGDRFTASVNRC